ncbi:hypothetical protein F4678DRAFT_428256 [Xylaria arbuscula]|nr:hypothetical protein F4678DRAFT_428256 [Xylaria arbuscula]
MSNNASPKQAASCFVYLFIFPFLFLSCPISARMRCSIRWPRSLALLCLGTEVRDQPTWCGLRNEGQSFGAQLWIGRIRKAPACLPFLSGVSERV